MYIKVVGRSFERFMIVLDRLLGRIALVCYELNVCVLNVHNCVDRR